MVVSRTIAAAAGCWLMMLALLPASAAAQLAAPSERLSDRDVKQIIDAVDQARDRFEDQLDGKLTSSILRGPRGETNVAAYLDDLQENVKHLKDRFKPDYSASKEAETILRQGTDIHTFVKAQPGELKGGSAWDRMAAELGRLAAAYGTTFPLPANAVAPQVEMDPHAADLGLAFYTGTKFPQKYRGGLFSAQHGSWNRTTPIGARIMFTSLKPDGTADKTEVFAEGWLDPASGTYRGRPVDVAPMKDGSLLVPDDFAGAIYRITYGE